jgi:hypothetical protein
MPVYSCPHCAKRFRAEAELTRRINCPHCGQPIDPAPPPYARPALPPQQPPPEPAGPPPRPPRNPLAGEYPDLAPVRRLAGRVANWSANGVRAAIWGLAAFVTAPVLITRLSSTDIWQKAWLPWENAWDLQKLSAYAAAETSYNTQACVYVLCVFLLAYGADAVIRALTGR